MTIRVYLVDDHALVRTGMKMILSGETDIEVVGEAETGEDALRDVRQLLPDVVLCDLHLPGVSGMEVTERIVRSHRNTRVVIVSVLEDGPLPKRLLEAGAAGYIGKGCDAQELLRAVRDVAMGRRYLGTSIAQNLALSTVEGNGSPFDNLSPRELEVALLLTQGLRQEDIARRLSLSAKTVNTHKARLFEKMGIHDNIALARMASQYGLVDPARPPETASWRPFSGGQITHPREPNLPDLGQFPVASAAERRRKSRSGSRAARARSLGSDPFPAGKGSDPDLHVSGRVRA